MLSWGGVTYPFRRSVATMSFSALWAEARDGLGGDLSVAVNSNNFFVGLENLHHILGQAEYVNRIYMSYGSADVRGSALYDNFTVGPESESYQLRYDRFSILGDTGAGDGFAAAAPVVFCASDRDATNRCAAKQGAAGWYGSDCNGYSPFSDSPEWPFFGVDEVVSIVSFALMRAGEFYDAH